MTDEFLKIALESICAAGSALGTYELRVVQRDEFDDYMVSTAAVTDVVEKPYETAVLCREYDKNIMPVESYGTLQEAKDGHARWIEKMKPENRPDEIADGSIAPIKLLIERTQGYPIVYKRAKKGGGLAR